MGNFLQDLRYAFRLLTKSPGFAAIAIVTLGLGIGANTAIFTVVNAVLLRPLGFRDPSRLVIVAERTDYPTISTSYQNYVDWRDQSHSFEGFEATRLGTITLTGAGEPERLNVRMATAPLFSLVGVNAILGRTFLPEEDRPGGSPVALLSYGLWQRRFGGSRDIVGKVVTLDSQPYTVVGVLPSGFELLQPADVFLPFAPWAKTLPDDRNWHPGIFVIGRLKEGFTREQARTEMIAITKRLEEQYPLYNTGKSADVVGLQDQLVQNVRPALLFLLGAVAAVLLIACVNVANLLLARAASRGREVAIRTSMGATRWRVTRQLLTESVLLSLGGGLLGLLLAKAALGPLLKLSASALPAVITVSLDKWVLAFTLLVSLFTGLLFGIVPALRTASLDLRETLNEGSRGSTAGPGQHRIRGALVATEIALAMLLLVGAGLLLRSFSRMQDVPPGFQTDHLLVADIPLSLTAYAKPEQRYEFFDRLVERARTLPGVRSAGAATFLPVSGGGSVLNFNIVGKPPKTPHDFVAAGYRAVTGKYFETLGIPLIQGRFLTAADTDKSPAVVVINTSMAKKYFPGENPLGKHLHVVAHGDADYEIVGVVADTLHQVGQPTRETMYFPILNGQSDVGLTLAVRTASDPLAISIAVQKLIAELDPQLPVSDVFTMQQIIERSLGNASLSASLVLGFAVLSLILASVGLYGVLSYLTTQRTGEIGVRLALGARREQVVRLVLGDGLRPALYGLALGLAASLGAVRLIQSMLYGTRPLDPAIFAAVAATLLAVAVVACLIPAWRASRIDPMQALRTE